MDSKILVDWSFYIDAMFFLITEENLWQLIWTLSDLQRKSIILGGKRLDLPEWIDITNSNDRKYQSIIVVDLQVNCHWMWAVVNNTIYQLYDEQRNTS